MRNEAIIVGEQGLTPITANWVHLNSLVGAGLAPALVDLAAGAYQTRATIPPLWAQGSPLHLKNRKIFSKIRNEAVVIVPQGIGHQTLLIPIGEYVWI